MNTGVFVISLDFELHWGRFDKIPLDQKQITCLRNTRDLIPAKLDLFARNGIGVTWAVVGMLYNHSLEAWNNHQPVSLPHFTDTGRSAYAWLHQYQTSGSDWDCLFAPDVIDSIRTTPDQEIGTHTYSHYYCLERGEQPADFRFDLLLARQMATERGIDICSLVFPRNQYSRQHLEICRELGITSVRTNPPDWYWKPSSSEGPLRKIFRSGDAYIRMGRRKSYSLQSLCSSSHRLPLELPASRLYRPWQPGSSVLNTLKLQRILQEMTTAARNREYYHLWWHPENFGDCPEECLQELSVILTHFNELRARYGFQSMTMKQLSQSIMSSCC